MSDHADAPEITPLQERLTELIKLKGPITVADYMSDALGHPHDGYYMSQEPIGADGDFITAPEISQVFGELIGLWLVEAWRNMGSPKTFNLIELGPGRGVLMEDMLRAARLRPEFTRSVQVWLLEVSGRLRHEQQKRLRSSEIKPLWADDFDDIPPAPSLIIANEFFDCLPIRQFQNIGNSWRERLVGLTKDNENFEFVLGNAPPPSDYGLPDAGECDEGEIFEISFATRDFMANIHSLLNEQGGTALIIDYGHMHCGFGDTLQAVRHHKYWPPLASPGRADITAHVDFDAIVRGAIDSGVKVHGPSTQGQFLDRLGLALRIEMLCKGKSKEDIAKIQAGASRIAASNQMGEVFKVLCISSPSLPIPSGFDAS